MTMCDGHGMILHCISLMHADCISGLKEQIQDLKVQKLEADLSLKDKEIQGKDKDIQELKAELARKKTNIWGARAGARTRAGGARGGCVQHLQGLKKT